MVTNTVGKMVAHIVMVEMVVNTKVTDTVSGIEAMEVSVTGVTAKESAESET